jgi:hypothetical protein
MTEKIETTWITASLGLACLILLPLGLAWLGIAKWIAILIWALVGIVVCWYCFIHIPRLVPFRETQPIMHPQNEEEMLSFEADTERR